MNKSRVRIEFVEFYTSPAFIHLVCIKLYVQVRLIWHLWESHFFEICLFLDAIVVSVSLACLCKFCQYNTCHLNHMCPRHQMCPKHHMCTIHHMYTIQLMCPIHQMCPKHHMCIIYHITACVPYSSCVQYMTCVPYKKFVTIHQIFPKHLVCPMYMCPIHQHFHQLDLTTSKLHLYPLTKSSTPLIDFKQ